MSILLLLSDTSDYNYLHKIRRNYEPLLLFWAVCHDSFLIFQSNQKLHFGNEGTEVVELLMQARDAFQNTCIFLKMMICNNVQFKDPTTHNISIYPINILLEGKSYCFLLKLNLFWTKLQTIVI